MTDTTRVRSDVDFGQSGKQISYLAVPISTNDSAYGTVTIPIAVLNHGTGPTFLLTGGVHGDEYEGPVTLMNLSRELEAEQIQGRLILIPCLNLPAVMSGTRCSPLDNLNLNRVFPGSRDGSITEVISHFVCHTLLPLVDIHVDLHSGGKTLEYIPTMMMWACEDEQRRQRTFDAIQAFGAPVSLIDRMLDPTGIMSGECEKRGIMNFGPELGGAGRVDKNTVNITKIGIFNLLKHFEMLEGDIQSPEHQGRPPSRLAEVRDVQSYVMAPDSGLYEPFIELWDSVAEGQIIGQVHYPDDLNKSPVPTYSARAGFLLCKRPPGQVRRGDNVAIIGEDLDLARYGLR